MERCVGFTCGQGEGHEEDFGEGGIGYHGSTSIPSHGAAIFAALLSSSARISSNNALFRVSPSSCIQFTHLQGMLGYPPPHYGPR